MSDSFLGTDMYATLVPGRSPAKKVHSALRFAKSALSTHGYGEKYPKNRLFRLDQGQWVDITEEYAESRARE